MLAHWSEPGLHPHAPLVHKGVVPEHGGPSFCHTPFTQSCGCTLAQRSPLPVQASGPGPLPGGHCAPVQAGPDEAGPLASVRVSSTS